MHISTLDIVIRMIVAVVLSGVVGLERERIGRPAGLRTHLLVGLASATFMLVSTQFVFFQFYQKDDLVIVDTSRIAASVVTGIGFLGAGAILRVGMNIQGLTTAASLWLVAAVGLAAGGGMFLVATLATGITFVALTVLRRTEGKQWRLFQRQMTILLKSGRQQAILDRIHSLGAKVISVDYDEDITEQTVALTMDVRFTGQEMVDSVLASLSESDGVKRVRLKKPSAA